MKCPWLKISSIYFKLTWYLEKTLCTIEFHAYCINKYAYVLLTFTNKIFLFQERAQDRQEFKEHSFGEGGATPCWGLMHTIKLRTFTNLSVGLRIESCSKKEEYNISFQKDFFHNIGSKKAFDEVGVDYIDSVWNILAY